jgi:serine/threonine protein kinase/Tfp pilus assembly protein PilF
MNKPPFSLSADNWHQVEELLAEALEQPADQRTAFLGERCGSRETLRRELESLLDAFTSAGDFLDRLDVRGIRALLDDADDAAIGQKAGPYRIVELLGRGGMGVVYLAEDERLGRKIALKFLPAYLAADTEARQRLLNEARASAALDHPNVGVIHEVGETAEGRPFIAMAYYEGETLADMIRRERLAVRDGIRLIGQVARGLRAAHQQRIVHCDLKPSNIVIARGPEGTVVKIVDFGIARLLRGERSLDGSRAGTIAYMAPEQTRGEVVDVRADLWSLGVILYEILAGRRPFNAATVSELVQMIREAEFEPMDTVQPDIPPVLEQIVSRCLKKDAQKRYPDVQAFIADLERFEASRSSHQRVDRPSSEVFFLTGRLAVLPLQNLSPDPQEEYFALSMADELISRLAKLSRLKVIGRATSMLYAGTKKRVAEIGLELGVPAILSGSVRKVNDEFRITMDLMEAQTEEVLWSETYHGKLDVPSVQRDIAERVAEALKVRMDSGEHERLLKTGTRHRDAYESYLKGRHFLDRFDEASVTLARDHFQQALHLDPAFAEAWAGLADVYKVFDYLSILAPKEAASRSRAAGLRALDLDPDLASAHTSMATVLADYYWDWETAAYHFRRAIELNPGYPTGRQLYAEYLRDMGCFEDALKEIRKAQDLDPLSPFYDLVEGTILISTGRAAEASALFDRLLHAHPNYQAAYFYRALSYLHEERYAETLAATDGDAQREIPDALTVRGMALAFLDRKSEALAVLVELDELSKRRYVSPFNRALVHMALGDIETVLQLLEEVAEEHGWFVRLFRTEPTLYPLRSHPRFVNLLAKIGLNNPRPPYGGSPLH